MDNKRTGRLIFNARQAKGLTQKQLAEILNVSDKTVSKWERGAGFPDVSMLIPLSDALGLSLGELMSGEKAPQPPQEEPKDLIGKVIQLQGTTLRRKISAARVVAISAVLLFVLFWAAMLIMYLLNQYYRPAPRPQSDFEIPISHCDIPMSEEMFCAIIGYYMDNYPVESGQIAGNMNYGAYSEKYSVLIECIDTGIRYNLHDREKHIWYTAYSDEDDYTGAPAAEDIYNLTATDMEAFLADGTYVEYGSFFYFLEEVLTGKYAEHFKLD